MPAALCVIPPFLSLVSAADEQVKQVVVLAHHPSPPRVLRYVIVLLGRPRMVFTNSCSRGWWLWGRVAEKVPRGIGFLLPLKKYRLLPKLVYRCRVWGLVFGQISSSRAQVCYCSHHAVSGDKAVCRQAIPRVSQVARTVLGLGDDDEQLWLLVSPRAAKSPSASVAASTESSRQAIVAKDTRVAGICQGQGYIWSTADRMARDLINGSNF